MEPPIGAGSLSITDLASFLSAFVPGAPAPVAVTPLATPAAAAVPKGGLTEQTRVNAWLGLPAGRLTHLQIRECCIKLSAAKNWEMLEYAVSLVKKQLSELKAHVRLLWIIRDNLETLMGSKVLYLGREASKFESLLLERQAQWGFKPPVEMYLGLKELIAALSAPENATLNFTKKHLQRMTQDLIPLSEILTKIITSRKNSPAPLNYFAIPTSIQELWTLRRPLQISAGNKECFICPFSPEDCRFECTEGFSQNLIIEQILSCTGLGVPCKLKDLSEKAQAEWTATDLLDFVQTQHKLEMEKMPPEFRAYFEELHSAELDEKLRAEKPETLKTFFSAFMNTPGMLAQVECAILEETEQAVKELPQELSHHSQDDGGLEKLAEVILQGLPENLKRKFQDQLRLCAKKGDAQGFAKCREEISEDLQKAMKQFNQKFFKKY